MPNIHSNISFGLVNIPIVMNPVVKNNDTSFNQLHKKCLKRIKYVKYCEHCKKEVKENEIVKGYEFEKDNYLTFEKEELDKLKPENDKEIEIVAFVDEKEVDSVYMEKSYLLTTERQTKAYDLFCEALKKVKKVAIAKTVIGSKFYYVMLRFTNYGIVMTTLFFQEEVLFPEGKSEYKVNDKELDLAVKLIAELEDKFEPEKYQDEYQNNIKKAIDDKMNGKEVKQVKKKQKEQVSDLFEALEKSLKKK